MNTGEVEIYNAIRQAQAAPTTIRHNCLICKEYLSDWETHRGDAICWSCKSVYFPAPKVEEKRAGPPKATLVQLRDGKYVIILY